MRQLGRFAGAIATVIIAALALARPALAELEGSSLALICGPPNGASMSYSISDTVQDTEASIRLEAGGGYAEAEASLTAGYNMALSTAIATDGTVSASAVTNDPGGTTNTSTSVPGAGDIVVATIKIKKGGTVVVHTEWTLDCDALNFTVKNLLTGETTTKSKDEPYTGIVLLPPGEQAPYLGVPNPDGVSACGVFDVNGWGRKYIGLADFPNCTPPDLTVMCFDGDGEWAADNAKDVYIRPDGAELDFTSSQHGICGIFPTS